jgi:hypothetical protein
MRLRSFAILPSLFFLFWLPLARGDEAAGRLVLATYKLANESSTATGTVYRREAEEGKSECFLVTAGHVFEGMKGDTCTLVSRTLRDDGLYMRQEIQVPVRQNGEPLWKKHANHDLAVLLLPESASVECLPFDSLATEDLMKEVGVGDAVRLSVFPERSEANPAGLPILRGGVLASHPLVPVKPHPAFLVDTTTWTGDSGGAVMHESLRSPSGGPLVLGIVRGMRSVIDTAKESRFVERKTQYPLGISEVLQAVLVRELIGESWPRQI